MTDEEREIVMNEFDKFLNHVNLDVCDFLSALGTEWYKQADTIKHPACKSALESDGVSHAGLDFYVSTK